MSVRIVAVDVNSAASRMVAVDEHLAGICDFLEGLRVIRG
jgi:hypothetical protein